MQNRHLHRDKQQAEHARNRLAEHRRQRRAKHAQLENQDERQIQNDIEHRRQHQEKQRRFAVAQRTQPAGEQIIQECERNARKYHHDIIVSLIKAILRRVHQPQNIRTVYHRQHGHHHCKHDGQPCAVGDKLAHTAFLVRAELLRHRNGKTRTDAHAETQHQKIDRTCRAHARERLHAQKTADDQRIDQIIQLLKQHAGQKRQSKAENQADRRSLRQILGH